MCGIAGFTNFKEKNTKKESKKIIGEMYEKLSNRGPDEDGIYVGNKIIFGHKRLIVIDPESGKQPMKYMYQGSEYIIVYNGQIYNCDELRNLLKKNGFDFVGHSDTEVLLKAYMHYGYEVVNRLNGIFALLFGIQKRRTFFSKRSFRRKTIILFF